tara:strand:+ start:387 stop:1214 length:828 start_codon:yes stop_codon:yes gene_type:complete
MAVIGSPPGAFPQLFITKSQTWVPPQDGTVCIHAVGAGGGGNQGADSYFRMNGGGAGAYFKVPSLAVTTSGSFTIVIGAGGRGGHASTTVGVVGAAGGNTTIAGTGLTGTKTAGGGAGGATNNQSAEAAGGSFSGSGESAVGYSGGAAAYGSGGAVGVYATGQSGQNVGSGQAAGGQSDAAGSGIETSGFGIIVGGRYSGNNVYNFAGGNGIQHNNADDLNGGGLGYATTGNMPGVGGNGGLGGGGGAGENTAYTQNGYGGHGGDGIIIIQYLPW